MESVNKVERLLTLDPSLQGRGSRSWICQGEKRAVLIPQPYQPQHLLRELMKEAVPRVLT